MRILAMIGLAGLLLTSGCTTPEEQRAMDQQRCAGYGFQPGTDAFAQCMMQTSMQRDAVAEARKDRDARYRILSQQRSGDPRFPVCGAAMPDVHLDASTGTWFGPNCRAK